MCFRQERAARQAAAAFAALLLQLAFVALFLQPAPDPPPVDEGPALQAVLLPAAGSRSPATGPPVIRPRLTDPPLPAPDPALEIPIELPEEPPPAAVPAAAVVSPEAPATEGSGGARPAGDGRGAAPAGDIGIRRRVLPVYPPLSAKQHEEGDVLIGVVIDARGRASHVRVLRRSGFQRLDEAAERAVRQWTFTVPAGANGDPEELAVRVGFHLASGNLGFRAVVVPFDAPLVARINAAAAHEQGGGMSQAPTEADVRDMAGRLLAAHTGAADDEGSAAARALIDRGAVLSARLMGVVTRTLETDFDAAERGLGIAAPGSDKLRWYVYAARQERGTSEWLLSTQLRGGTRTVEVMAGGPACPAQAGPSDPAPDACSP